MSEVSSNDNVGHQSVQSEADESHAGIPVLGILRQEVEMKAWQ